MLIIGFLLFSSHFSVNEIYVYEEQLLNVDIKILFVTKDILSNEDLAHSICYFKHFKKYHNNTCPSPINYPIFRAHLTVSQLARNENYLPEIIKVIVNIN